MQLKLDNTKTYAIALEGGGAKGAYQIGAWQALHEAGIKYNAVSGTSVGALNGALMCMGDLERAKKLWGDIRLSDIINVDEQEEKSLKQLMNGKIESVHQLFSQLSEIVKNRGLDVAPLRAWVRDMVDAEAIHSSGVELFITTVNLSERKGLEIRINDLSEDEICDMLLASSYHPSFRLEKLGGKLYADGAFVDSLPDHVLVKNGYTDIIAVRLPGFGIDRPFKKPEGVNVTTIQTRSDLGFVLNFDAELSKSNMLIGYYDAQRVLYGLYGKDYYIDRSISEKQSLEILLRRFAREGDSLRRSLERSLPKLALEHTQFEGDYYDLLIAVLEKKAHKQSLEKMKIYSDTELVDMLL